MEKSKYNSVAGEQGSNVFSQRDSKYGGKKLSSEAFLEEKTSQYHREKEHDKHQKDISQSWCFFLSLLFCFKCLITVSFLKNILLCFKQ